MLGRRWPPRFDHTILSNLLAYYRATGDQKNLELVKKVSPVAWLNVNLNGTYSFTFEQNIINMAEISSPLTGESGKPKKQGTLESLATRRFQGEV